MLRNQHQLRHSAASAASAADFFDETSSKQSEDAYGRSYFTSDSDPGTQLPGPCLEWPKASIVSDFAHSWVGTCNRYMFSSFHFYLVRVSATHGNNLLPPVQECTEFSPKQEPGVHLSEDVGVLLSSRSKKFLAGLDFFFFFFSAQAYKLFMKTQIKYNMLGRTFWGTQRNMSFPTGHEKTWLQVKCQSSHWPRDLHGRHEGSPSEAA